MSALLVGKVKFFDSKKGFGFATIRDGNRNVDVYIHASNGYKIVAEGNLPTFSKENLVKMPIPGEEVVLLTQSDERGLSAYCWGLKEFYCRTQAIVQRNNPRYRLLRRRRDALCKVAEVDDVTKLNRDELFKDGTVLEIVIGKEAKRIIDPPQRIITAH